jgi:hypothetical protein
MKTLLTTAAAALLILSSTPLLAEDMIPAENATRFVGKDGMVCGTVEKARYAEGSEGQPTFLYMGGKFPRHTFSARIDGADRGKFPVAPESLEGKDVCVIGKIARDNARAEIVLNSPSNLKLATIK